MAGVVGFNALCVNKLCKQMSIKCLFKVFSEVVRRLSPNVGHQSQLQMHKQSNDFNRHRGIQFVEQPVLKLE